MKTVSPGDISLMLSSVCLLVWTIPAAGGERVSMNVPAGVYSYQAPGAGGGSQDRIQFARGASSATRKGSVRGDASRDYVIRASQGQTLSVNLNSQSTFVYFNVLDHGTMTALEGDPRPMEVTQWAGKLPKTGDYVIRVYLNRAATRRGTSANYTLKVVVTGSAACFGRLPQQCRSLWHRA